MAGESLALAFGSLMAGAVVVDYGVKSMRTAFSTPVSASGGPSQASKSVKGFPTGVDPLPGAVGSRLDQGIDGTGSTFLSPWAGKVVWSTPSDPGWDGGGYVAIQSSQNPSFVYYVAEGITPIVHLGEEVTAGQRIAQPVSNPYNGIVGNFEAGRANPAAPQQPLAQVVSDPATMVLEFYHWLLDLGGPHATSTSLAGHS